jgi:hypothetical protein
MSWLVIGASLLVAFIVFGWMLKVVKATIGTALAIAGVVLALQLFFGIGPGEIWSQLVQLWNNQVSYVWESLRRTMGK